MEDNRSLDRRPRAGQVRPRGDNGRARPPGPEEQRGATATSGQRPEEQQDMRTTMRSPRFWIILLVLLAINWLLVPLLFPEPQDRVSVPYTFFKQQVASGNVSKITSRGEDIQGEFKQPIAHPDPPAQQTSPAQTPAQTPQTYTKFATIRPAFEDLELLQLLEQNGVVITAEPLEAPRSPLLTLLFSFGPTLLLLGGFLWLSSRAARAAGGGVLGLGQSRARRYEATTNQEPITFDDVAGIDEVEDELVEIVDFLKQPDKYQRLGGSIPKGVLLVGPPGTGKTLLARAVAGEAGVPFFSMSGSEFIEVVVGVGAARVRDLFAQARKAAPSIVFVDELDAIGRRRGAGNFVGGNDEREQTLNQLLIEMDGFDSREAVIVLAATNRSDVLDPALLRPGRFDRRVIVQPPDRAGRAEILKVHTRGVPLAPDVDLSTIAGETPGLVGADLRNLINEAALLAARKGHQAVIAEDFAQALEKIALGAERRLTLLPEERERVAYHESGHALLGLLQPEGDPVRRVTVVPRGQALGVTLSVPEADRYNYGEPYLRARIVSALGGRAAEQVIYSSVTTGAENDLTQVTQIARAMVTRWGMSQEVGLLALSGSEEGNFLVQSPVGSVTRPYSEETAQAIDAATRRIVDESYTKALELLRSNRERLDALAQALLREESLGEEQMREATGLPKRPATESAIAANR
ncbi:MAG TPA: ATP-dependent zinc metalloprotease FtsH [Roseiflexaceae bacterium]|nr:ATP-dependent zinc metalloprotease FtsH [Roseiflexaceae bacterium]